MRGSLGGVAVRAAHASKPVSGRVARFTALCMAAALASVPLLASGQVDYKAEDAKRSKSAEVVGALGDDLFGELFNRR